VQATAVSAEHARRVVELGKELLARRVVGLNGHGNVSVLDRSRGVLWMSGSSLVDLDEEKVAELDLDGVVVGGSIRATEAEVVRMHTEAYRARPTAACVVHTHAPHATAFAVASRTLGCVSESMARQGLVGEVPLAPYAPRGSIAAVGGIVEALARAPESPAVLLESHGVLVVADSPAAALRQLMALEEGAQLALLAAPLGEPRGLSREEALAVRQP
jgi:L-fuculose-phosphate aldolase